MLLIGYGSARFFKLNLAQSVSISVESGIQNGTLGIMIASTLLHNDVMAISPAIYSLIMFVTAGVIIAWMNLVLGNQWVPLWGKLLKSRWNIC
jgi:bile acid:Na+ symporter, BASS family